MEKSTKGKNCVQYGVWSDCCNSCDFCLRKNRAVTTNEKKIESIRLIRENLNHIDWVNQFSYGISLLGGELFYIKNKEVQDEFMLLIDDIIEKVLLPNDKHCRFSTVTNGLYEPSFLYRVIDRIVEKVGIERVDVNFSYDLKGRYKTEKSRLKALKNINDFKKRYNYCVGVQMILTQNVINLWKRGEFKYNEFVKENFDGCRLTFLYPHKIHTKAKVEDFFFSRKDFLQFLRYLKDTNHEAYINFIHSTKNSGTFKYTGMVDKGSTDTTQKPVLWDGKEVIMSCGHSELYRCYSDSDKCILCDLKTIDGDL